MLSTIAESGELSTDPGDAAPFGFGNGWNVGMSSSLIAADIAASPVPLLLREEISNASRAVRTGELRRVDRGVYAPADLWRALAPWERYLARVHAVALVHPKAVFVLESGLALRGLPVFGEPPDVHVLVARPEKSRVARGVRVHSAERMPQCEQVAGIHVATAAELAIDVIRARHPAIGLAVAGAVLRQDPSLTRGELAALCATRASPRGIRTAEWVLARATSVPESPLENVSLAVLEWLGFPSPQLQTWFRGSDLDDDRVDFWWPRWRVAGEADGDIKYSGALGDARDALRARNVRDARLASRGVRATAHWTWRDVAAFGQLRALLVAAGLPVVTSEHAAPLRTLERALRGSPATATR